MPQFFLKYLERLSAEEKEQLANWLFIVSDADCIRAMLSIVDKDYPETN